MFYFLLHIPFIHLLAVIVCDARDGHARCMFEFPDIASFPFTQPPGWGFSLSTIYLTWIFVVVALYPACRWFADFKQRRSDPWLSYL
jgi:hypothetical protein